MKDYQSKTAFETQIANENIFIKNVFEQRRTGKRVQIDLRIILFSES